MLIEFSSFDLKMYNLYRYFYLVKYSERSEKKNVATELLRCKRFGYVAMKKGE